MGDNGQTALGFGAYFGLLYRAHAYPNFTTAETENKWTRMVVICGVTLLLCLPVGILFIVVKMMNDLSAITSMVLGLLIPVFYAPFVLVGFSEHIATKLSLLQSNFTMYRHMRKNVEYEDIECRKIMPEMTLVTFNRQSNSNIRSKKKKTF